MKLGLGTLGLRQARVSARARLRVLIALSIEVQQSC